MTSHLKFFRNPRKCLQRFGFVKYLTWQASRLQTSSLQVLGKLLKNEVTKKVKVQNTDFIENYNSKILKGKGQILNKNEQGFGTYEVQDVFLSDPKLKSNRGSLGPDEYERYIFLPVNLGFFNKDTYSILDRGVAFLKLTTEKECLAFRNEPLAIIKEGMNPFSITPNQTFFLLYCLLENDWDVLLKLLPRINNFTNTFNDSDAGDLIPEVYFTIVKEKMPIIVSGIERQRLVELKDTAQNIEKIKGTTGGGGKNTREHAITFRLELLVDLGLLNKPNPINYKYELCQQTKKISEYISTAKDAESFLLREYFNALNDIYNLKFSKQFDEESSLDLIIKANKAIGNNIGYSSLVESCLLANIWQMQEQSTYFEIQDAIIFLLEYQKREPKKIRFMMDRMGVLKYVKFL